jgi:hypothetical protein
MGEIMSAINTHLLLNNLPITNQNSTSTPLLQSKISNKVELYLGPSGANLPGMTNFINAPLGYFKSVKALIKAKKIGDCQGLFENSLRIVSAPFSFFNGASSIASNIIKAGIFLKIISQELRDSIGHLSIFISVLGFIICTIELVLETFGLVRAAQFYLKHFPSELESINKNLNQTEENIYLTKLTKLQYSYLKISSKRMEKINLHIQANLSHLSPAAQQEKREKMIAANLESKKNNLIRCVQPGLANEIEQAVPEIIQNLQSTDQLKRKEGQEKAAEIFDQIKVQSYKKFLIHAIGIATVLVTVSSLILSCIGCPFFILVIMMIIGTVLSLTQNALSQGLLDSKGWKFEFEKCLPSFLKSTKKQKPPEKFLSTLYFDPDQAMDLFFPKHPSSTDNIDLTMTIPLGLQLKSLSQPSTDLHLSEQPSSMRKFDFTRYLCCANM